MLTVAPFLTHSQEESRFEVMASLKRAFTYGAGRSRFRTIKNFFGFNSPSPLIYQ